MRWVYLSPHPDDAALCAGGLIFDQQRAGDQVEIWTFMTGIPTSGSLTPYARVMHERWSTTTARQTVELRREEDLRAAHILGAKITHLGFLDAIYRTTAEGEALYGDPVGAPQHPQDAKLVRDIRQDLKQRLRGDEVVVTPLGIGDHADHVIVRRAAEGAGCTIRYVADFPYVLQFPESLERRQEGLESELYRVSESGVAAWIEAVGAYASQLGAVFREMNASDMIRLYWKPRTGIRMWSRASASSPGWG